MHRARENLRMKFGAGLAVREIVRRTDLLRRTVRTLFARFASPHTGLTWTIAPGIARRRATTQTKVTSERDAKVCGLISPRQTGSHFSCALFLGRTAGRKTASHFCRLLLA